MGSRHLSEVELVEYCDGETDPRRLGRASEHVQTCEVCSRAVARVREAAVALGRLSSVEAPADLRTRAAQAFLAPSVALISCGEATPLLHEHLDGCLSPAASVSLQHHLDSCAKCSAELAVLASAGRLVRALPEVDSPARVRESVFARRPRRASQIPVALRWSPALAAAAAMLAFGLLSLLRQSPQPESRPVVARAPAARDTASPTPLDIARDIGGLARGEPAAEEAAVEVAEEVAPEAAERPRPQPVSAAETVVRPVSHMAKGPAPARVTLEVSPPEVVMPAGLQALRVVASIASHDTDVKRAMELAGERFAVLNSEALSEATLAGFPLPSPGTGSEEGGVGVEGPAPSPSGPAATEKTGPAAPESSPAPGREGASILLAPLV